MQRIVLLCFLISSVPFFETNGQTQPATTTTPSWLPAEKKDTSSQTSSGRDLKSFVSGLDPKMGATLPGGKSKNTSLSTLMGETIPDLGLRVKEYKSQKGERQKRKDRAKLAKVQYKGIPMETREIKFGSGDRATLEVVHVLKEYKEINPYVRQTEIRWYDKKTRRLSSSLIKDKSLALPLHGSYKKYVGENVVEEGFYYMGVKDGRWAKYDSKYILLDKMMWDKGFPAESRIAYYDSAHTKVREVVPVLYGQVQGEYLKFYNEGQLMANGKYADGKKIGRWVDYYQFRRLKKKETQYPKSSWDEDFEPFVLREWDDKGKLLYDYTKDPRASVEEEETATESTEN